MNNKKNRNIIVGILVCIVLFFSMHFYAKYFRANLEKYPKLYCYEIRIDNSIKGSYYIDNLDDKEKYIEFYREQKTEERDYNNRDFNRNVIIANIPLYILEYTEDSLLAKFYGYNSYDGLNRGTSIDGWVYVKNLHKHKFETK